MLNQSDNNPLVSIALPVYNGAEHIAQAIESLIGQDYSNIELVIVDNASDDQTPNICKKYALADERVSYVRNDVNLNAIENFQKGFQLTKGDFFMWAAHDDFWEPAYVSKCLDLLLRSEKAILCGSQCRVLNPDGNVKFIDRSFSTGGLSASGRFKRYKKIFHGPNHIGAIFYGIYKRKYVEQSLPFRNRVGCDQIFLCELSMRGEFLTVSEVLMTKRYGGASKSHKDNAKAIGLKNNFLIKYPYFFKEMEMQKIIIKAEAVSLLIKIQLCLWSFADYLRLFPLKKVFLQLKRVPRIPAKVFRIISGH